MITRQRGNDGADYHWLTVAVKATDAQQQKSGFRLMCSYCYLYRCAELNGGVQIGVDLGAGGIGPHTYMVLDRCYLACLDAANKSPFGFNWCSKVLVKACVGKGNMTPGQETNSLVTFASEANAVGPDIRICHCTLFMAVWSDGIDVRATAVAAAGNTHWPAACLTYQNNLQVHGTTLHYTDFIRDQHDKPGGVLTIISDAKGNCYTPEETSFGGGAAFSTPADDEMTLSDWNALGVVDNDVYGSITPTYLNENNYVPSTVSHTAETTGRTTTSDGVYQDYYGNSPVGGAYRGAVSRAV